MAERRPTNSELRLARLEGDEARREAQPGILELFDRPEPPPDEDAPLARDDDARPPGSGE
jgi:hypothetical protein